MKRITYALVLGSAVLGMGIAMPDCGQQVMQQQIEEIKTSNQSLKSKIASLDTSQKTMTSKITQIETLLQEITKAIGTQKDDIAKLQAQIAEMSKPKAAPARGGRKR